VRWVVAEHRYQPAVDNFSVRQSTASIVLRHSRMSSLPSRLPHRPAVRRDRLGVDENPSRDHAA
jgi:hypothetical protein